MHPHIEPDHRSANEMLFSARLAAILGVLCLAALLATGAAQAAPVKLAIGESTVVTLEENTSTGYRWSIDERASEGRERVGIDDLGHEQGGASGGRPLLGAPGLHRWRLTAKAPGRAVVVLVYTRPWEHAAPARTHRVEIEVGAAR
jgi:inhibitor of cysteine peptidase